MAKEPTSMYGHMMVAAQKTFLAPLRFVGNAAMQAAERLIPQGATEVTNALWTGNAYAPPVLHAPDQGNVHGTAPTQQQVESPQPQPQQQATQQQATGWGEQAPMGHREIGYSANHKIIDMQPQIAPPDYTARIEAAAARGTGRPADHGRDR